MGETITFCHSLSECECFPLQLLCFGLTVVFRPYYVWLGRSRSCDVTRFCHALEVEGGNTIGNCSPVSLEFKDTKPVSQQVTNTSRDPELRFFLDDRRIVINITAPLSSFHYQIKKVSFANYPMEFNSHCNCSPGACFTMSSLYTKNLGASYILSHG